jgi:hypothetical protein
MVCSRPKVSDQRWTSRASFHSATADKHLECLAVVRKSQETFLAHLVLDRAYWMHCFCHVNPKDAWAPQDAWTPSLYAFRLAKIVKLLLIESID